MGRLELPASCSQSKRATNCATPGYEIFQLWSNMWSTPIFDQLPARGKMLSAQVSQGFPGFPRAVARTWASRSQSWRATNCTIPGYSVFCMIPHRKRKSKFFVSVGGVVVKPGFAGGSSVGGFPPQATVPRTSGLSLLGEWMALYPSKSSAIPPSLHPNHFRCPSIAHRESNPKTY